MCQGKKEIWSNQSLIESESRKIHHSLVTSFLNHDAIGAGLSETKVIRISLKSIAGCFLLTCASKLKSLDCLRKMQDQKSVGNPSIRRNPSFYHQSRSGRATGKKLRGSAPPQD
ncbi:uncharacterized protein LOC136031061 isoform X2 [Artemia franciscana]|uniref:uncharacterized protein LOC136031061 isoform X2 n=1 Tax=Artemia franciscana TaxID=6661 RepID=UPI0032D9D691